jgi:hypothetical protein
MMIIVLVMMHDDDHDHDDGMTVIMAQRSVRV